MALSSDTNEPAMARILPSLPTELWDDILDHLWHERNALKACSLTCRQWLPTARLHLFREFRYPSNNDELESGLESMLVSGSTSSIGSIAMCVRCLTVNVSSRRSVESMQVLSHFTNTIDLTLHQVDFFGYYDRSTILGSMQYFAFLVKVESLRIEYWTLTHANDFIALVSTFPALSHLCVRGVMLWKPPNPQPDDYPFTTSSTSRFLADVVLESWTIYQKPTLHPNIFQLLGPPYFSRYPPRLKFHLWQSFSKARRGDETAMNETLSAAGASLQHLYLCISEPIQTTVFFSITPVPDPELPILDLWNNTGLLTLTVEIPHLETPLGVLNAWMIALLSRTSSEHLERVEIIMPGPWDSITKLQLDPDYSTDNPTIVDVLAWSQIGTALSTLFRRSPGVRVRILVNQPTPEKRNRAETARRNLAEQLSIGGHVEVVWK